MGGKRWDVSRVARRISLDPAFEHWFSGMPYRMPCGVPRPVVMDTDADVDDDLICTDANSR